jgi:hypothetical protein
MTNTVDTSAEVVGRDVALLLAMAQAHQYPGAPILRMVAAAYKALAAERDEYVRLHSEMGVRCRKAREERDRLAAENARLRGALRDLMTWFPDKPSPPEWRLPGGQYGADEAVAEARAALGDNP